MPILCCVLLAACGLRAPEQAPLLSITDGRYAATIEGVCMTLHFGRRDRQTFLMDADCDGAPDAQSAFTIIDDQIVTDAGTLAVTAVGAASFSGVWTAAERAIEAQFQRVDT